MNSSRIEALSAAVLIAAAAGLLLMAIRFPTASGVFPIMVLAALLITSVLWLVRSLLAARKDAANDPAAAATNHRQLYSAAAVTAAYGVGVSAFSFFIPTVIFIPAMAFILGNRNLPLTIASGTGFVVMIYVLFVLLFERPIPLI